MGAAIVCVLVVEAPGGTTENCKGTPFGGAPAPQKFYLLPRFVLPTHWLTAT
jgi:hypothetical protein